MSDLGSSTGDQAPEVAQNNAACQPIKEAETAGAGVSFEITYRDPSTGELHHVTVTESVSAGRDPSNGGLTLSSGLKDPTISADAVRISEQLGENEIVIQNTSSYAPIEVQRDVGSSPLAPTEKLTVSYPEFTVVVPGKFFRHPLEISFDATASIPLASGGTQNFVPADYELPGERREVLAHLCAPMFYPSRFSSGNSATDISARIQRRGGAVSAREVNNKIQRTRESIDEKCLTELSNREELAAFLVTHKLITKQDIHNFVLNE